MAGCLFDAAVPSDARLACVVDAECPEGFTCSRQGCLPAGVELPEVDPTRFSTVEDEPVDLVLSASNVVEPRFRVTAPPTAGTLACADGVVVCADGCDPLDDCVIDGVARFEPLPDQNGTFTVSVLAQDPTRLGADGAPLASDDAIIAIDIEPANDPPSFAAGQLTLRTTEDTAGALNLLAVVSDVDGDAVAVTVVGGIATRGAATLVDATALYQPFTDEFGTDTFEVRASDGTLEASATVDVIIEPVNDAPVLGPRTLVARHGEDTDVTPVAFDAEGEALVFQVVVDAGLGVLTADAGRLWYRPTPGEFGLDIVTVAAIDPHGATSEPVNLAITIEPALHAFDGAVATTEDAPVQLEIAGVGVGLLDFGVGQPTHGLVTVAGTPVDAGGAITSMRVEYRPDPDFHGEDSFEFFAIDDAGLSTMPGTVTVTVSPINDAPRAPPGAVASPEDQAFLIVLVPTDVDGDELVSGLAVPAGWGVESVDADRHEYRLMPPEDYVGTLAIGYSVSDGSLSTDGIVTVTVTPVQDPPVPLPPDLVEGTEDQPVIVLLDAFDPDGDALAFSLGILPAGWHLIDTVGAIFVVAPAPNAYGAWSLPFQVSDGLESVDATVDVALSPVDDPPTLGVVAPVLMPQQSQTLSFQLTATDPDADAALTFHVVAQPRRGLVTTAANGAMLFQRSTMAAFLEDSFVVRVSDGALSSLNTVVAIQLTGRESCAMIKNHGESIGDQVHVIDPGAPGGSDRYLAFCDQTTAGGGWTLALRADGRVSTFDYDSPYWTNPELLNTSRPTRADAMEAKLASFSSLAVDEVLIGIAPVELANGREVPGILRYVRGVLATPAASLQDLFSRSAPTALSVVPESAPSGRLDLEHWRSLMPTAGLDSTCTMDGANQVATSLSVRLGMVSGNTTDCASVTGAIGIGANVTPSVGHRNDGTDDELRAFGVISVRALDFTSFASQASCADHRATGRVLNGWYLVGGVPQRCDDLAPTSICLDGFRDGDEECDDGNFSHADACDRACRLIECGNGRVEGDEACDDSSPYCIPAGEANECRYRDTGYGGG